MEKPWKYRTSESTEEQASKTTALFVTHIPEGQRTHFSEQFDPLEYW